MTATHVGQEMSTVSMHMISPYFFKLSPCFSFFVLSNNFTSVANNRENLHPSRTYRELCNNRNMHPNCIYVYDLCNVH